MRNEELERTAELGVSLLLSRHILAPDLHAHLPEVIRLWYTMRQQEDALCYWGAVIRYVASAGQNISAQDGWAAIKAVAPGTVMLACSKPYMKPPAA